MIQARQHFPGLLDKTFLDAACVSPAPRPAVEAIEKFLDLAMVCPLESSTHHHIFMDEMRAAARPACAALIAAHSDEIALVESTTHGLSLAADAIPLQPGDRVLLSDLEFLRSPSLDAKRKTVSRLTSFPTTTAKSVQKISPRASRRARVSSPSARCNGQMVIVWILPPSAVFAANEASGWWWTPSSNSAPYHSICNRLQSTFWPAAATSG
jgi:hypothetical protein